MLRNVQYSEKGGVGKTSVTDGLAAVAGDRGYQVVVVDADPRATATEELGIEDTSEIFTLNDLLYIPQDGDPPDPAEVVHDVLQPAGKDWPSTVRVIAAERNLANRETDPAPIEGRLRRALLALEGEVDIVLCDLPPRAGGKLVTTVLTAATKVVIPATLTADGLKGIEQARKTMRLIQQGANPDLEYAGIVRSIVPRDPDRRAVHDLIDDTLAETYSAEVLDTQIREYAVREESRVACVPITAAPGREAKLLVKAYGELLDHLVQGETFNG